MAGGCGLIRKNLSRDCARWGNLSVVLPCHTQALCPTCADLHCHALSRTALPRCCTTGDLDENGTIRG